MKTKFNLISKLPKRKEYAVIFWIGVLIFVLSNQYFGWNKEAQSGAERVFDFIWTALVILGAFGVGVRSIIEEAFRDMRFTLEEKDK